MLVSLSIKNVALIDEVEIEFCKGLNILSGETGAGKSVILDSLNFVLGAKADKTMIRHGEQYCMVTCVFNDYPQTVADLLQEFDVENSDELIIKRKFDVNGNGYIKLNGENVTATMLRKITAHLVDVHGQSEHFSLLSKTKQLACIDLGAQIQPELTKLNSLLTEYQSTINTLESLGGTPEIRAQRLDMLDYQINEIEKANLQEGEKETLTAQKVKLLNLEKISNALHASIDAITSDEGITDRLYACEHCLKNINDIEGYSVLLEKVSEISDQVDDLVDVLNDKLDQLDCESLNIDEIEQRLEIYKNFARKYGNTVQEINEYLQNALEERDNLLNFEKTYENLLADIANLKSEIYKLCVEISQKRKVFAKQFCKNVSDKLAELGMPNAKFDVHFEPIPNIEEVNQFTHSGLDKIEFLFTANAGEPVKPLSKIISGGEMSRFMLALKTQLSVDSFTYVFDEIDAGISGVTAGIVAKQFAIIAKNKQVIAISHLPQITAMSDKSLLIVKHEDSLKTFTKVYELSETRKVEEIIRLIGGNIDDEIALSHAKNMISEANNFKSTI